MKLYLINQIANKAEVFSEPRLYAVSDNKKLVDRFLKTRYKDYFYVKRFDHILKEKYRAFRNTHAGYFLRETEFMTKDDNAVKGYRRIKIVVTTREEETTMLRRDQIWKEMGKSISDYSDCFNKELTDALDALLYYDIRYYNHVMDIGAGFGNRKTFERLANVKVDELSIFLFFFGSTIEEPREEEE